MFGKINGRGVPVKAVLDGIDAASEAGLKVKINMVVKRGMNEHEIIPMAKYFREKGHILRFIEFMDVGNTNKWNLQDVYPKKQIVEDIHKEMPLEPVDPNYKGEVASRYRYVGSQDEIGVISSVSMHSAQHVIVLVCQQVVLFIHVCLLQKVMIYAM